MAKFVTMKVRSITTSGVARMTKTPGEEQEREINPDHVVSIFEHDKDPKLTWLDMAGDEYFLIPKAKKDVIKALEG